MKQSIRKMALWLAASAISFSAFAQPQFTNYQHDLNYFLPKSIQLNRTETPLAGNYNKSIPTPKEVLGFELGERYCEWADVLRYIEAVDAVSDRIKVIELGRTQQRRPIVELIITSEKNHANLDKIHADHLALLNPTLSAELDIKAMPIVSDITCSIHGNEASGVHAAVAMTYLFAASEDEPIKQILDNTVLLLVPGANPDGINSFSTFNNCTAGDLATYDNDSREHKQPWPSFRTNHYWTNLNRDFLMCQHPESKALVRHYLEWMPNLVLDLHEQLGPNFFHSPGHPLRVHPYITDENQSLTGDVGKYVSHALEPLGAKPYCGRGFDDFYLGKGAAYGDVQGSICLLFESPNTRNHVYNVRGTLRTFPDGIRNQVHGSLAGLASACDMREKLLIYQRDFYRNSATAAKQSEVQGYLFHANGDKARAYRLLENLAHHQIEVYHLAKDTKVGKEQYTAEESYIIPLQQRYYYKLKAIWERLHEGDYKDNRFYDITTWTFPLAYNVTHAEVSSTEGLLGKRAEVIFPEGSVKGGKSDKAYMWDATPLYSFNIMRALLKEGVKVDIATKPFKACGEKMGYGTCVVEVAGQPINGEALHSLIERVAKENGVDVIAADDKFKSEKLQLQSARMPKVAVMMGQGVDATNTGEIWMLLEKHFGIAPSLLNTETFTGKGLDKYDVIIFSRGGLPRKHKALPKLKEWVEKGGTLITIQAAYKQLNNAGLASIKKIDLVEDSKKEKVYGVIFNSTIDPTTPLGYGYTKCDVPLFKHTTTVYDEKSSNLENVVMRYTATPHLSGWIPKEQIAKFASTPAAFVLKRGSGRVIHFADSPTFRGYWYGTTKMFMNAIYFGHLY